MDRPDGMDTEGSAEAVCSGTPNSPICLIVLGMAGSGKTTFVQV